MLDAREEFVKLEPWLDKAGLCAYLACSEKWIELRMTEGMPHARIAGRIKFRVSEVEPWLEARGHLERIGDGRGGFRRPGP
ncbi:MAG TPA: hypothetical protein VK506_05015 [Conexibacter sp.]|nr:hypothetical protein [Conexibacter sp.]